MKAKGHCVWLVAKERKLGVNDLGSLRLKAVPRAAAVYDRQLKIRVIMPLTRKQHFCKQTKMSFVYRALEALFIV